jgi:hypothetical protein
LKTLEEKLAEYERLLRFQMELEEKSQVRKGIQLPVLAGNYPVIQVETGVGAAGD